MTKLPLRHQAIVPSDTVELGGTVSLYFGQAGTARLTDSKGNDADYVVTAGTEIWGEFRRFNATGTVTITGAIARYAS